SLLFGNRRTSLVVGGLKVSEAQLVWSGKEIPLATALSSAEMMTSVAQLVLHNKEFRIHFYRGFTSFSAIDRTDSDYSIMAKMGSFQTPVDFIKHQSPTGGAKTEFLEASHPTREAALKAFCEFVDKYHSEHSKPGAVADPAA
ncbi:hypothetical protein R5W24_006629, partial [Gemmata sp. JC717]|uniref:hypothetical protein n=1 Tax=Gemmata algarum TaxID=2975278 RepID=UPI0021BB9ECD